MALRERIGGIRDEGRHPVAGLVAAGASVVVWGASSVLIKQIEGVSGLAISFHRLWIGAVLTGALFLATGGRYTRRLLRLSLPGGLAFALDIALVLHRRAGDVGGQRDRRGGPPARVAAGPGLPALR